MAPVVVISTVLFIVAIGLAVAGVIVLATESRALTFAGIPARVSRLMRRSCLMPIGFVAFVVVTSGQLQGQGAVPSLPVSTDFPRGVSEDTVTRMVTQGGAVAVLLVVLWSYRRDFFRRDEERTNEIARLREEKGMLQQVLERSTAAIRDSVNATANQTLATNRLAAATETIERKLEERRRGDHSR